MIRNPFTARYIRRMLVAALSALNLNLRKKPICMRRDRVNVVTLMIRLTSVRVLTAAIVSYYFYSSY